MEYSVTFCVFDHTVGGNPFWHGSFFLSKLDKNKNMLEVVDTWGFYGVTSTGDKSGRFEQFKREYHLDVDLQGNHGMLTHEELRFMDLGHGLHGYTFELMQQQFDELRRRCVQAVEEQEAAIREIIGDGQNFKVDPQREGRIYREEAYSRQIYEIEQIKAKIEGRPSRLKPFDFQLSLGYQRVAFFGFEFWLPFPSVEKSNTCKTRAVSLLEGILTEKQLAPFKNSSLPRFIPGLEPILLHSEGTLRPHTKTSGKQVFFRNWKDKDVKLYWSVPPQAFDPLSQSSYNLCRIDADYQHEVKKIVSQLQRLEWAIRNASLDEMYQSAKDNLNQYKNDLADRIMNCYRKFSTIEPKSEVKISGWQGFALSLFALPRNEEGAKLQFKIYEAKMLLNSVYMAIVDRWEIFNDYPSETSTVEDAKDYNALEALASYLSSEDKKILCEIIGRSYLESEELNLMHPTT